jgi:pimeloyl-ACP methyl ester carboxylesterase
MPTTFVLVHGAWHGGWCWQKVDALIQAAGHRTLSPTLTGLGDRAHLASRDVGLGTHIEDVAATLHYEDLTDVVLVGHSYAGQVITGVAEVIPERIASLVYYDAFVPDDRQTAMEMLPEQIAAHFLESAQRDGDGWLMPKRPLEALGVTDACAKAWLEYRLVPHPLRTYQDAVSVSARSRDIPSSYVSCTNWAAVFAPYAVKAKALGWPVTEIFADHEALATAPELLVAALLEPLGAGRD